MYEAYQKPGCYCITIEDRLVYIGKSVNIYKRFLQHRNRIFSETNQKQKRLYQILRQAKYKNYKVQLLPLYWSKETDKAAIKADITAHEALLIRKYIPVLNLEIPWYNGKRDYINKIAYNITLPQILSLPIVEIPIARPEEEQT